MAHVLIASRISSASVGGLAGYQRGLGAELAARSVAQVSYFTPDQVSTPKFWMSLASRPWSHALLERAIDLHYLSALKALRAQKFDAVHYVGTGWDFLGFAMCSLARSTGARFTIWPAVHPGVWADDVLDLRLYNQADHVLCQSDGEALHLQRLGLHPDKIVRCGLPAMCLPDGDGLRLRQRLDLRECPAILFLGRRDEGKGYPSLLRSWPTVLATHPEAVLLLAGPGGSEYAHELNALPSNSIRDLGVPDEKEKADALAACTIFCLPSAHESFGIVYVEAWSYGKPVICGPAEASRELVRPGETGLWADHPPSSIAHAITQLLDDPARSQHLGDAGHHFQNTHLTWEQIVAIHREAFGLAHS
ncbi:hypothetical protein BH09VER1_BH09VER1_52420 [soil metagenome]